MKNNIYAGVVDRVLEDSVNYKIAYILIRGYDTFPATIQDIALLSQMRDDDRSNGKKKYTYMIFCERAGNEDIEKIARNFNINYIKRNVDLATELKRYFND